MGKSKKGSFEWLVEQVKKMPGEKKLDRAFELSKVVRELYNLGRRQNDAKGFA